MATAPQSAPQSAPSIPHASRLTAWLPKFLRDELAPYPGRAAIVARMVIACTLTVILIAVFRIPGGSIAVLLAMILAREDFLASARSAFQRIGIFAIAGIFVPIGGRLFAGEPLTHFLWEAASIFLCFFLLRTLVNFAVASSFSLVATNILAIWYLPGPASRNVELTLWQVLAASVGSLVALAVEAVFHAVNRRDEVLTGVTVRLRLIEQLMRAYAAGERPSSTVARELSRYAVVGVGVLRRHIARTASEPIYRMRTSTLVSLTGRAIDFAAALPATAQSLALADRERAGELARHLAEICVCLPLPNQPSSQQAAEWEPGPGAGSTPLLNELEAMTALIPSVLASDTSLDPRLEILDEPSESSRLFVRDAFRNPEHLRYALSGTAAAMVCYILYMGLNWPALATSVTTCVLTGLSNIGASRQKQVLRIAGAVLGGFVFGMGAQIFVLPAIDTIGSFALLCAAVTAVAAWISTSSSRLSYAGLQLALAFYLIVLSEPTIQLSLSVARDRVLGVLLGIFMMWLVFERLYTRPAAGEMVSFFIRNTRLIADLVETTVIDADAAAIVRIRGQREHIYRNFGEVNAQSDAVPFETGALRAAHMAARDRIRRWQTAERTFYLLQAPLLQFRIFADSSQRTHAFYNIETSFRIACGKAFRQIAASIEAQLKGTSAPAPIECSLLHLLDSLEAGHVSEFTERERALMRMTRTIGGIVDRMAHEVAAEPLFAAE
jgi:multidrug resistance protein MdtO